MAPDELLGGGVEVFGRHPGPDDLAHQGEGAGDDPSRPGHDLDLAGRLEGDHLPRARLTRAAISSTAPSAGILLTPPRLSYQASTGAV